MGTVRVEDHHYPPGEPFNIPGLGGVVNFEDTEVDEGQIEEYKSLTGAEWPESDNLVIVSQDPEPEAPTEESAPVEPSEGTPAEPTTGGEG